MLVQDSDNLHHNPPAALGITAVDLRQGMRKQENKHIWRSG